MMKTKDAMAIGRLDAYSQAALVRSGELSASELVTAAIERIEALDPSLNAVTHRAYETALARAASLANGALAGDATMRAVPYLLKDGMDYAGMPSAGGSRFKRNRPPESAGSDYSDRLDRAGLIALGKSNAPEFGLLPSTESLLHGASRNPWNRAHSSGGSSGGAAVAVASGMVPIAHAADGGGSIRIPASCCGVFGLKPSRGANVRARGPQIIEDLLVGDTLLSRSVRDSAWAFALTSPTKKTPVSFDPESRRLRIGLCLENFHHEPPVADVAAAVRASAELCQQLGHEVEEIAQPFDGPAIDRTFKSLWGYLAQGIVGGVREALRGESIENVLEPWTLGLARQSATLTMLDVEQIFLQTATTMRTLADFHSRYDVLLSPAVKLPPPPLGELAPDQPFERLYQRMFDYVSYTPLHNLAGTPAMSVPLYVTKNQLPIGTMFSAARGQDELLLQLAFELEQARPWAARWPEYSAPSA